MKRLGLLLILISTRIFGQNIQIPDDLNRANILMELNSPEATVSLMSKEFERTNDADKCDKREVEVLSAKIPDNRTEAGDIYALAIPRTIVKWINKTIVKSFKKEKKITILTDDNRGDFTPDKWRYILKYKYVFKDGDPTEISLIFFFFDRIEKKELIDYTNIYQVVKFRPVAFSTSARMYPLYDMSRIYDVKKDFEIFFKEL